MLQEPRFEHLVQIMGEQHGPSQTSKITRLGRHNSALSESSIDSEQNGQTFAHLGDHGVWCSSGMFDRSLLPRDAARLVGQYGATDAGAIGQRGLERVAAHTAGDWTDHAKTGCGIVIVR